MTKDVEASLNNNEKKILQYSLSASKLLSPNVWEGLLFHPRHHFYSCVEYLGVPTVESSFRYENRRTRIDYFNIGNKSKSGGLICHGGLMSWRMR